MHFLGALFLGCLGSALRCGINRSTMCRSIKILRRADAPATREEMSAAALQFVRKVSGYRKPSRANQAAFDRAVKEVADSVERLLGKIATDRVDSEQSRSSVA